MPDRMQLLYEAKNFAEEILMIEKVLHSARTNTMSDLKSPGRREVFDKLEDMSLEELTEEAKRLEKKYDKMDAAAEAEATKKIASFSAKIDRDLKKLEKLVSDSANFSLKTGQLASGLADEIISMVRNIELWEEVPKEVPSPYDADPVEEAVERHKGALQRLSASPRFRPDAFRAVVDTVVNVTASQPHGGVLAPAMRFAFEATSHLKTLVYLPGLENTDIRQRSLEVKFGSGIYLVPTLALGNLPWSMAFESCDASDFSEADLETIATLRGDDAYPTLKDAVTAAINLR